MQRLRLTLCGLTFFAASASASLVAPCSDLITSRLGLNGLACEQSISASQDFRGGAVSGYTVNQQAFFNETQWGYLGSAQGGTEGQGGTLTVASTSPLSDFLLIFKGPNAHSIIGIFVPYSAIKSVFSLEWKSPFLKKGKNVVYQDVSHVSLYARAASVPVPPPPPPPPPTPTPEPTPEPTPGPGPGPEPLPIPPVDVKDPYADVSVSFAAIPALLLGWMGWAARRRMRRVS